MERAKIEKLNYSLRKAFRLNRTLQMKCYQSSGDLRLLRVIAHHSDGGLTPSQLAEKLEIALPTVSRKLSVLEKQELIQRQTSPDDRRKTFVYPTEKGHQLLHEDYQRFIAAFSSVSENLDLFKLNSNYVQDLDGNSKEEIKPDVFEKIDVKSANKPAAIATFALIAASVLGIVGFSIAGSTFNYSNTTTFTRVEVRSADTRIFESGEDSGITFTEDKTALENLVFYIENVNKEDGLKVSKSWTVTNQVNPYEDDAKYIYFYVDLDKEVESLSGLDTFVKLDTYVKSVDTNEITTLVNAYTVDAGVVVNDYFNSFVLMAVALGITLVYFLIRYRYTFAI